MEDVYWCIDMIVLRHVYIERGLNLEREKWKSADDSDFPMVLIVTKNTTQDW